MRRARRTAGSHRVFGAAEDYGGASENTREHLTAAESGVRSISAAPDGDGTGTDRLGVVEDAL